MAKDKTSISMESWILTAVRKYAEANGLSVSTVLERGALREIAAGHSPAARAAVYGANAATAQMADEELLAADIQRTGEAA